MVQSFFTDYLTRLEEFVSLSDEEDPTIDLKLAMQPRRSSPNRQIQEQPQQQQQEPAQHQQQHQLAKTVSHKGKPQDEVDTTLRELEFLAGEMEKKSPYGIKLAEIMIKGLKVTCGPGFYQDFLHRKLPENYWFPIVYMNDDNTPLIEFLAKSPYSEHSPFSQVSKYSMDHMILSKFIADCLCDLLQNQQQLQQQIQEPPKTPKQQQVDHLPCDQMQHQQLQRLNQNQGHKKHQYRNLDEDDEAEVVEEYQLQPRPQLNTQPKQISDQQPKKVSTLKQQQQQQQLLSKTINKLPPKTNQPTTTKNPVGRPRKSSTLNGGGSSSASSSSNSNNNNNNHNNNKDRMSLPTNVMLCSTPKHNSNHQTVKRPLSLLTASSTDNDQDMDSSRRSSLSRACKLNSTVTYKF